MTGHNALSNQAIWRAGHWEIVTCPLVEMTWMEIYEMTPIYFELRNYQKKIFGCPRYEELRPKYFYSFNPHLPTYQISHPQFEIYPFRLVGPKNINETVLMERRCIKHYFQCQNVNTYTHYNAERLWIVNWIRSRIYLVPIHLCPSKLCIWQDSQG